jgi:hypothetical protein
MKKKALAPSLMWGRKIERGNLIIEGNDIIDSSQQREIKELVRMFKIQTLKKSYRMKIMSCNVRGLDSTPRKRFIDMKIKVDRKDKCTIQVITLLMEKIIEVEKEASNKLKCLEWSVKGQLGGLCILWSLK